MSEIIASHYISFNVTEIATVVDYSNPDQAEFRAVFYDSHGSPWVTCSPDHPEAKAFGPTGTARRSTKAPNWVDAPRLVRNEDGIDFIAECRPDCPVCGVNGTHKGRFENSQGFIVSVCELELETY
jgi:hypothetical protein